MTAAFKRTATSLACALLLHCTSPLAGTYGWGGGFSSESLELRDDGTFRYVASSDDSDFEAEGTWVLMRSGEIMTDVSRLLRGEFGLNAPLRRTQSWTRLNPDTIIRTEQPLRRFRPRWRGTS
jgi:hypothetical protein